MATPLVHIVDYFDTSCSSESPQDPFCSPVLPSWTTFWLPQDPATKGSSTQTLREPGGLCCMCLTSIHSAWLVLLLFWFLNILWTTSAFMIHLIIILLDTFLPSSPGFMIQMSTTLKSSYSMSGFIHLSF